MSERYRKVLLFDVHAANTMQMFHFHALDDDQSLSFNSINFQQLTPVSNNIFHWIKNRKIGKRIKIPKIDE